MHENAGSKQLAFYIRTALDIGLRMDFFSQLYREIGVNIVVFAYRGYSKSEGSPNEAGLKLDADVRLSIRPS
jgi:abhydrolase domain-containing protein 13